MNTECTDLKLEHMETYGPSNGGVSGVKKNSPYEIRYTEQMAALNSQA